VLFDQNAHVYILVAGAPAALWEVSPRLLPGVRGIFTTQDADASHPFFLATTAPAKLLCHENMPNSGGGSDQPRWQGGARPMRWHDLAAAIAGSYGLIPPACHTPVLNLDP